MYDHATPSEKAFAVEAKKTVEALLESWIPGLFLPICVPIPTSVCLIARASASWEIGLLTLTLWMPSALRPKPELFMETTNRFSDSMLRLPPCAESVTVVTALLGRCVQTKGI
jgi:hypothetical protein